MNATLDGVVEARLAGRGRTCNGLMSPLCPIAQPPCRAQGATYSDAIRFSNGIWMRGRNLTVSPGYEPSVATFYYPARKDYRDAL
jgi:hypothetical protein